ncbi:hypothetical protein MSPP1_002589 [Malassezia sp. CBS 17886]|nr:hypothetical protein MSPP1_002589 [Malassezia sp. CBS 17886]
MCGGHRCADWLAQEVRELERAGVDTREVGVGGTAEGGGTARGESAVTGASARLHAHLAAPIAPPARLAARPPPPPPAAPPTPDAILTGLVNALLRAAARNNPTSTSLAPRLLNACTTHIGVRRMRAAVVAALSAWAQGAALPAPDAAAQWASASADHAHALAAAVSITVRCVLPDDSGVPETACRRAADGDRGARRSARTARASAASAEPVDVYMTVLVPGMYAAARGAPSFLIDMRMSCLRALHHLASHYAQELVPWWSRLLPGGAAGPTLFSLLAPPSHEAVCDVLQALFRHGKGHWAMGSDAAERSPPRRPASFTSLSTRIGGMAAAVRDALGAALAAATDATELRSMLLTIRVFVYCTRSRHQRDALRAAYWPAVVQLCVHFDIPLRVAAHQAAVALLTPADNAPPRFPADAHSLADTLPSLTPVLEGREVGAHECVIRDAWALATDLLALGPSLSGDLSPTLTQAACRALDAPSSWARRGAVELLCMALAQLSEGRGEGGVAAVEAGAASVGQATTGVEEGAASTHQDAAMCTPTRIHARPLAAWPADDVLSLLRRAMQDRDAAVRTPACSLWVNTVHVLFPQLTDSAKGAACRALLAPLLEDECEAVRAAAVRAVGVLLSLGDAGTMAASRACVLLQWYPAHAVVLGNDARSGLLHMHDASVLVRTRSAWAFANWCAIATMVRAHWQAETWQACLQTALRATLDDGRVSMHAVRALGIVLGATVPTWAQGRDGAALFARGMDAACTTLRTAREPKLRWNAATCVARAVDNTRAWQWDSVQGVRTAYADGIGALADALSDRTFKVKLLAAQALHARVCDGGLCEGALDRSTLDAVRTRVASADAGVESEVQQATFGEAQLHGHAARACIAALHIALCGGART